MKVVILHVVETIHTSLKNRKLLLVYWKFLPIQSSLTKRTLSSASYLYTMLWGPCINAIQCVIWQVCVLYIYCLVYNLTPVFSFLSAQTEQYRILISGNDHPWIWRNIFVWSSCYQILLLLPTHSTLLTKPWSFLLCGSYLNVAS